MAGTSELVGIAAATGATLPVDRMRLATDPTGTALGPLQLDGHFLLQKLPIGQDFCLFAMLDIVCYS